MHMDSPAKPLTPGRSGFDRLIVLTLWWLPFLAITPFLFRGAAPYIKRHASAILASFLILISVTFLVTLSASFADPQTDDAIANFIQAIPMNQIYLTFHNFEDVSTRYGTISVVDKVWVFIVLTHTFIVMAGKEPYFLMRVLSRPLFRGVGALALIMAVLAWAVSLVTAAQQGVDIARVDEAAFMIGFFCYAGGLMLLKYRGTLRIIITLMSFGSSVILGTIGIYLLYIDFDAAFLPYLGVGSCALSFCLFLLKRRRTKPSNAVGSV